ncbi:hypothetical protein C5E45_03345 [Nocardia nova]|uniref:DUF1152 domain-containing protein n=1 Tax=Nocardia nova TaxID=37330 RepID=A0A2S6AY36_9NOCA|nr:DUF1152 domain-containing protein [Nocardia nova]PPJ34070.1 hypothetical protein C5E41_00150 [Nocardia nova]PPJ40118.1 hypothetical protein C5E45_03345 [Nocardia nova]
MTAVAVAAGGGGDAITASALAGALPDLDIAAVMSWSWDRLMMDPVPGPRTAADFVGLLDRGGVSEVSETARLIGPGRSTLPQLARHVPQPLLLIDASAGVVGLAEQMRAAAGAFGADRLVIVDVGGDIVAEGNEANLRSPLADAVTLAAAVRTGLPVRVLVAGIGLDGELTSDEVIARLALLDAKPRVRLRSTDYSALQEVWAWHPSEANGLLAVATAGFRGRVETQRGAVIEVTDSAVDVHEVPADALARSTLAAAISQTTRFADIERVLRHRRGYSDVDIERDKLANRDRVRVPTVGPVAEIDRYAVEAAERGIDALTVRRVSELIGVIDPDSAAALRRSLERLRPSNFRPPLYVCRALNSVR